MAHAQARQDRNREAAGRELPARVRNIHANTVRKAAAERLLTLPQRLRHSLTLANGKKFAEHKALLLAKGREICFAKPYCAWQCGTNENTNGLVGRYFPQGTNLASKSRRVVAATENLASDFPRKRLGYRTPREVLGEICARRRIAFEF